MPSVFRLRRVVWPDAEFPIDEALVRRLLEEQQPDLAGLPLLQADAGWDNIIWRLGDHLAVRMPRREIAAPLIEHEQRWLPVLAERLPLPVPVPLRKGHPTGYYRWYWSVVPWLEGRPGDVEAVTDIGPSGERLGRFLAALHRPAPVEAPYNPFRSGPVDSRTETFEQRLAKLADYVDGPALRLIWDAACAAAPYPGRPVWVHGDLHPANTLVRGGAIAAVIDFGDLCAGDPAVDLGAVQLSLDEEGMDRFWAAYGQVEPAQRERSKGWAVLFALMLLDIGLDSRPTYATVGRATLGRIAAPSISEDRG